MRKKRFTSLLSLALALTLTVAPASALTPQEAASLLDTYYVDELPQGLLTMDSVDAMLEALGDPYTVYMTEEEYRSFLSSVNGKTVVGIGVSIEKTFRDGFQIMSVLPHSPALEAGLEAGDRIIAVNGTAVTAGTDISAVITGEENTPVTITIIRQADSQAKDYTLTRRSVLIPIVTYNTQGSAGVIQCASFGSSTMSTIQEALNTLDDETSIWIMDLRSNSGGTSEAAAGSVGLFAGSQIMVYFRDGNGTYNHVYTTDACPDLTDKPLIVLTSAYSASASELFTAAVRDHGLGISIGQRTYGKGIAQKVYDQDNMPEIFHGDAMKITVYRFFSPDGTTNQTMGVLPALLISPENTASAALLLSCPEPNRAEGHLKLKIGSFLFYIHLDTALSEENRAAFTELLEALPPQFSLLWEGTGQKNWTCISPKELAAKLTLPYKGRGDFSDLDLCTNSKEKIQTLATYGLVSGYEDGSFRPQAVVTRAEFCTMVAAALRLPASGSPLPFSDTQDSAWYADFVSAMVARGFIIGYDDGSFRPNKTITHEEMVAILSSVATWATIEGYELSQQELSLHDSGLYMDWAPWSQTSARNLGHLGVDLSGFIPSQPGNRETAARLLYDLMHASHMFWGES